MAIELNHTIVPSRDKEAGARFFARVFGLTYEGVHGHFAPVQVNDSLTLDFDDREEFEHHHYAFHVSEDDFDTIFTRIKSGGNSVGQRPPQPGGHGHQPPQGRPGRLLLRSRRTCSRVAYPNLEGPAPPSGSPKVRAGVYTPARKLFPVA